ncbi:hypothetical protein BDR05DRAFT_218684 [Suillus weaverae]|nr:hypothetical protein BDR05DRAFT_218684 [Suillus weaverae]
MIDGCSASRGGHALHIWTCILAAWPTDVRALHELARSSFPLPSTFVDHPPMIGAIFHDHISLWLPFFHMATHVFSGLC